MIKKLLSITLFALYINANTSCQEFSNTDKKKFIYTYTSTILNNLVSDMFKKKRVINFHYQKFTDNTCINYYDYKIKLKLIDKPKKDSLLRESIKIFNPKYKFFLIPQSNLPYMPTNDFIFYRITNVDFKWKSTKENKYKKIEILNTVGKNSNIIALNKRDKMFYFLRDGFVRKLIWSIHKNTTLAINKIYFNGKLLYIKENIPYKVILYNPTNLFTLINKNSIITYQNNSLIIDNNGTKTTLYLVYSRKYSDLKHIVFQDKINNKKYLLKQIGFKNKQPVYSLRLIAKDFMSRIVGYRFSLKEIQL